MPLRKNYMKNLPQEIIVSEEKQLEVYEHFLEDERFKFVLQNDKLCKYSRDSYLTYLCKIFTFKTIDEILRYCFFSNEQKVAVINAYKVIVDSHKKTGIAPRNVVASINFNGVCYLYVVYLDKSVVFLHRLVYCPEIDDYKPFSKYER